MMWRTIIVWAGSAVLWNFYERSCLTYTWLRFIPVHPIWHFSSGYGAIMILQTVASISENAEISGYWLPLLT
jgi:hypothetical protein